ncbi:MAG: hypothetical protein M3N46_12310 [Actinomycetota bacterium]|nr:hypothetical protein [Actinomycetota bacterium]
MACSPGTRARRAGLLLATATVLASLTACVSSPPAPPGRASSAPAIPRSTLGPNSQPSTSTSPPSATPPTADILVVLTGHATADNGATATVTATVHAPLGIDDPAAASMLNAMTAFCAGEVDQGVLADVDARFVRVDDRTTLLSGIWPIDLPLALGPDSTSAFVTATGGGAFQEQVLPAHPIPADYVPRCAEPAFITIGRAGSVFLAEHFQRINNLGLDNASFWGHLRYGFATPYSLFSVQRVTFDHCTYQLTALGAARLGNNPDFRLTTGPDDNPAMGDSCLVGGLTGH